MGFPCIETTWQLCTYEEGEFKLFYIPGCLQFLRRNRMFSSTNHVLSTLYCTTTRQRLYYFFQHGQSQCRPDPSYDPGAALGHKILVVDPA